MNQSKEMTKLAIAALEDKKANDVRVIDIAGVSVIADYFVIASGSNTNQVQAMADSVREALGIAGYAVQALFNLNQSLTTPYIFLLAAMAAGIGRRLKLQRK